MQDLLAQEMEMKEIMARKFDEYNPLKRKKKKDVKHNPVSNSIATTDDEKGIVESNWKPTGSKIRIKVKGLEQNKVIEFRVRCENEAGFSFPSRQSRRVKTNSADPPKQCVPPLLLDIGVSSVVLTITVPPCGGAPITNLVLESRDLDVNVTVTESYLLQPLTPRQPDVMLELMRQQMEGMSTEPQQPIFPSLPERTQRQFQNIMLRDLRPGGCFQFRVRADSEVGAGEFSIWSAEQALLS